MQRLLTNDQEEVDVIEGMPVDGGTLLIGIVVCGVVIGLMSVIADVIANWD
jgi:hypothetical protein